jgi:tRNA A37 threonylcarbamoyladenosine synthetase subunit TsaC/SUA5/YrdC
MWDIVSRRWAFWSRLSTGAVYGLECNALDPSAITEMLRPDPWRITVVHVRNKNIPLLWSAESSLRGKGIAGTLSTFWPGPLTVVAKAASHVPPTLWLSLLPIPSHPVADFDWRIASHGRAGATNLVMSPTHVSPTRASHVWDDLFMKMYGSLKPNGIDSHVILSEKSGSAVCHVGVEGHSYQVSIGWRGRGDITSTACCHFRSRHSIVFRQRFGGRIVVKHTPKRRSKIMCDNHWPNQSLPLHTFPTLLADEFVVGTHTKKTEDHVARRHMAGSFDTTLHIFPVLLSYNRWSFLQVCDDRFWRQARITKRRPGLFERQTIL